MVFLAKRRLFLGNVNRTVLIGPFGNWVWKTKRFASKIRGEPIRVFPKNINRKGGYMNESEFTQPLNLSEVNLSIFDLKQSFEDSSGNSLNSWWDTQDSMFDLEKNY